RVCPCVVARPESVEAVLCDPRDRSRGKSKEQRRCIRTGYERRSARGELRVVGGIAAVRRKRGAATVEIVGNREGSGRRQRSLVRPVEEIDVCRIAREDDALAGRIEAC